MMSSVLSQGRVTPTVCAREPQHSRRAGSVALAGPPSATGRCAAPRLQRRWAGDQRVELQRGTGAVARAVKTEFASFDDLIKNSEVPVLVDFYAVWCGPCQMISPILADIQNTLKNSLKVVKINTEKYPDIASRFQISALPTLILFKKGVPVDRIEGMLSKPDLLVRLRYFLNQP